MLARYRRWANPITTLQDAGIRQLEERLVSETSVCESESRPRYHAREQVDRKTPLAKVSGYR